MEPGLGSEAVRPNQCQKQGSQYGTQGTFKTDESMLLRKLKLYLGYRTEQKAKRPIKNFPVQPFYRKSNILFSLKKM